MHAVNVMMAKRVAEKLPTLGSDLPRQVAVLVAGEAR